MKLPGYITFFCLLFCFQQATYATDIKQKPQFGVTLNDTAGTNMSLSTIPVTKIDPKEGFKHVLKNAITGQGMASARLNPMAISFVENYIAKNKKGYLAMKNWGEPYLNLMDQVLQQHGIPRELKYLAVIESGLKATALSPMGALGPWNFMPATARNYGLVVNGYRDERVDYFKSTHAAARMLTDLYAQFNDWLLVIAAYNGGPGNVTKAIRKSGGSKDFWTLQYHLPNESMNHVKKFIGTHYIFEGEGGLTTLTRSETKDLINNAALANEEELKKTTAYAITGRFNAAVIMKFTETTKEEFERFNPNFDNEIALNGKYNLRLPIQKMNTFVAKRYEILDASMELLMKPTAGGGL